MKIHATVENIVDTNNILVNVFWATILFYIIVGSIILYFVYLVRNKRSKIRKYHFLCRLQMNYFFYSWFLLAQSAILGALIGMNSYLQPVQFEEGERFFESWFVGDKNLALRAHMDPMLRAFYMAIIGMMISHFKIDLFPHYVHYIIFLAIICISLIKDNVQTAVAMVGGEFLCFPNYTSGQDHLPMFGTFAHSALCKLSSISGIMHLFHMVFYTGSLVTYNLLHVVFEVEIEDLTNNAGSEEQSKKELKEQIKKEE